MSGLFKVDVQLVLDHDEAPTPGCLIEGHCGGYLAGFDVEGQFLGWLHGRNLCRLVGKFEDLCKVVEDMHEPEEAEIVRQHIVAVNPYDVAHCFAEAAFRGWPFSWIKGRTEASLSAGRAMARSLMLYETANFAEQTVTN